MNVHCARYARRAVPLLGLWLAGCAASQKAVPSAAALLPAPSAHRWAIVNVHEHIQSPAQAPTFLKAMDAVGVRHTVLVGSPKETIVGKGGFVDYDLNNAQILTIQSTYPDRFSAFVTLTPRDPDKLRKLEGYLRAGAKGVKLYTGHSNFYDLPLTDPSMEPVYELLERRKVPVLWHVNLAKFGGEFEAVLERHPRLQVILPHLGLSSIRLERLEGLMARRPSLYTDLSFGFDPFLIAALKRISRHPDTYRDFIRRHRERILFGSDMVVTKHKRKTAEWLAGVMTCYRQMLEATRYRCALVEEELHGLALDEQTLRSIYEENPGRAIAFEAGR